MPVIRVLAIIVVLASGTNVYVGWRLSGTRIASERRLWVSIHISAGIVLCVTSALLAFWAFTF